MRLVPTQSHVELALGAAAPDEARTPPQSLHGFVRDALAAWAPDLRLADPAATRLATRAALEAPGSPFAALLTDEPAGRVALAHAMDRTLGRLRRAGTDADQLRRAGRPRARELADILEAVDEILGGAAFVDPRSAGFQLAARLTRPTRADDPGLDPDAHVEGIVAWELDDLGWLEALHHRMTVRGGAGVTVHLPRVRPDDALLSWDGDDPFGPIADGLERRWASLSPAPELCWDAHADNALDRAAELVGVVEARDVEGEARAAARAVVSELERGAAPEAIAVVVPDLEHDVMEPLRAALADAGIPFCEPRGRTALTSPEVRAALALLSLAEGPVTRDLLIEVLRAPGIHAGLWMEAASEAASASRAALLAHRLRDVPVASDGDGRLFVDALARAIQRLDDPYVVALAPPDAARKLGASSEAWMPRALERMLASLAWLRDASVLGELCQRTIAQLDRLQLGNPSFAELGAALRVEARGGGALALAALGEGVTATRRLREALVAIGDAAAALGLGRRAASPGELAREIERALTLAPPRLGAAARAGAVRIARAAELCALDHELVVVVGLDERSYGGAERASDPFLDDATLALLPAPSRPPGSQERSAWHRAELAWAMAGARRLVLTRSTGLGTDDAEEPHAVVREAVRRGAATRAEPASRVARGASTADPRAHELVALRCGRAPDVDLAPRVDAERARQRFFLDPRLPAGPHTGLVPVSPTHPGRHLVECVGGGSPQRPISVTHVERAAACAFAGFARRVLRVRRAEDLEEGGDPRERGNLVHRALRAAFEASVAFPSDPRAALAAARRAAEEALGHGQAAAPLRSEAVRQAIADSMRVVAHALREAAPQRFAFGERRFGPGEPAPWGPLALDDEEGRAQVFVDGQLDRVDLAADGSSLRLVDYKTGKLPTAEDEARLALQLPLYAEVAARASGAPLVLAHYLRIRVNGVIEERPRKPEDRVLPADTRRRAMDAARLAVLGLHRGEVAPRPARAATCTRCDARDVCRRPAVMPIDEDAEDRS